MRSRTRLEGHAGRPGRRQDRPRSEGRSHPPRRRADPQDPRGAGPRLARGEFHQPARAGHGDHRGHRLRVVAGACRTIRSTAISGSSRSSFKSSPSRPCCKRPRGSATIGPAAWPCWPSPGSHEAEFSYHYDYSTSLGPRMQFDTYGNVYYSNYDPFTPEHDGAPTRACRWRSRSATSSRRCPATTGWNIVDEGMKPKFATVFAQLYLKVNEEEKAFPYIEKARADPIRARPRSWPRSSSASGPKTTTPTLSNCGAAGSSTSTDSITGPRGSR